MFHSMFKQSTLKSFCALTCVLMAFPVLAKVQLENSFQATLKDRTGTEEKNLVIEQKLLSGNTVDSYYFRLPAVIHQVEKEVTTQQGQLQKQMIWEANDAQKSAQKPIIFVPEIAYFDDPTTAVGRYLRDLETYIWPLIGARDIYIVPGRTVAGSTLHNCRFEITQWGTEFLDWNNTKKWAPLCLNVLGKYDLTLNDFSTESFVGDLNLLMKDEALQKPILWTIGSQDMIVRAVSTAAPDSLSLIVVDTPNVSGFAESANAYDSYLARLDALASQKAYGWPKKKKPSFYLNQLLEVHNKGTLVGGDVSLIGFNDEVGVAYPVNSDVLNYYALARADQPDFIKAVAEEEGKDIYVNVAAFSFESYNTLLAIPETARRCGQMSGLVTAAENSNPLLKDTFKRNAARDTVICSAIGVSMEDETNTVITTPTLVINGALDPYFSPEAYEQYKKGFKQVATATYLDGSAGTVECFNAKIQLVQMVGQFADDGQAIDTEVTCGWSWKKKKKK